MAQPPSSVGLEPSSILQPWGLLIGAEALLELTGVVLESAQKTQLSVTGAHFRFDIDVEYSFFF